MRKGSKVVSLTGLRTPTECCLDLVDSGMVLVTGPVLERCLREERCVTLLMAVLPQCEYQYGFRKVGNSQ